MTYPEPSTDPQAPQPTLEYASGNTGTMGYATFQPNGDRAKIATILLWIFIGLQGLILLGSIVTYALILVGGADSFEQWLNPTQSSTFWILAGAGVVVGLIALVIQILMYVYYMMWQYRASANLGPLGVRGQRYSPGWTVGWWFIPIANLWMPYRCMREIEHGSRHGHGTNAGKCESKTATGRRF